MNSYNVQFVDAGNCPITDFDIMDSEAPSDAMQRAEALYDMTGLPWDEVAEICIRETGVD